MRDDLPVPQPPGGRREILWVKWVVAALLAYWAVFATVAPVMDWDSQTYNLARLYIAHAGGLFGNQSWNSLRQVIFPWTFDAIHYPFLFLGWGYCLPSFACLLALLVIVYQLVAAAGSARHAWCCCLSLLALPTLVFQSVCTKNDVAVVFAVGCWYYAWKLWCREGRHRYLLFMALALGFAAGAKTTGLPFFGALGAFTLWHLRSSPRRTVRFAGWMALCFVLFGGTEIYLNNLLVYHAPFGPQDFIDRNRNTDGLAGAAASFIRYCFGNMSVGIDAANPASPVAGWLENACRECLRFVGLLHNLGYRKAPGEGDANLRFLKLGHDAGSDFGPVGALALLAGLVFVLARPWSDPVWKLSAAGLATLALPSYTVAWMIWNTRFLILPFGLLTLALTLWVLRLGAAGPGRFIRSAFLVLMVYSAIIYPLCSFNKKPGDLWLALAHRPVYAASERATMLEVTKDLRARAGTIGPSVLLLYAGKDAWVFSILEMRGPHVVSAPVLDEPTLLAASRSRPGTAPLPVYVLGLNLAVPDAIEATLTPIKTYAEPASVLYVWHPPTPP